MFRQWASVAGLVLISAVAAGQDFSSGDENRIELPKATSLAPVGDYYNENLIETLHYRAPQGHAQAGIRFGTSLADDTHWNWENTDIQDKSYSWSDVYLFASYGITDLLNFGVDDTGTMSNTASQDTSTTGWSDPTFYSSYRLFGGLKSDRFLTVELSFSPSTGTAVGQTETQAGNELHGDSRTTLALKGYRVFGRSEISTSGNLEYHSGGGFQYADGSGAYTWDPYTTTSLAGTYRFHIDDRLFAGGTLTVNFPFGASNGNVAQTSSWINYDDFGLIPQLIVGLKVSPEVLVTADYTYDSHSYTADYANGTQGQGSGINQYMHVALSAAF